MPEPRVTHLTVDQWDRIVGLMFDADLATTNPQIQNERRRAHWDKRNQRLLDRPGFDLGRLITPRSWPWD